jgi:diadenosine tetraphosphatase ApaH/serine/threonine PP2A family protein phosphatase
MRYAIISDIHSNLEALEVALQEIDRIGVDRIVSLGDLVGYNANPNECVRILRDRGVSSLMGNHDAAACGLEDPVDFNPVARAAILWTRHALEPVNQDFLEGLPEEGSLNGGLRLAHGSLLHRYHYLASHADIMENIARMQEAEPEIRVLFFGHTHIQIAFAYDGETLDVVSSPTFSIRHDRLYLVNPGSVGQPRDRDPRCGFLLFCEETQTVEFIRLPYDVRTCSEKIITAGLPRALADRLHTGW